MLGVWERRWPLLVVLAVLALGSVAIVAALDGKPPYTVPDRSQDMASGLSGGDNPNAPSYPDEWRSSLAEAKRAVAEIRFTDGNGRRWVRDSGGNLRRSVN